MAVRAKGRGLLIDRRGRAPEPKTPATRFPASRLIPGDAAMVNKSQIAGLAKQLKGSVKKAAGKATGNRRVQAEGVADKIAGKMQKAYGDIKDKFRKVI